MPPDYDAEAIARVMGLGFVNAEDVDRRVGRPSKIPGSIARVKLGRTRERLPDAPIDVVASARELQKSIALAREMHKTRPSRAVKVIWIGEGVIVVGADELPSSSRVPPSPALIEQAVEAGLHRDALRHVAETLAGGDRSKVASLEAVVVPKTTLERRKGKTLSLEESERTERVARLFVHAARALGTEAEAREFMTAPHPELNGRSPFEAAKTDLGARRVEDILDALEYGLAL